MYDALIVANGEIPSKEILKIISYRTLICTDGAALTLEKMHLVPDVIIGDMDSIFNDLPAENSNSLTHRFPKSHITRVLDQNNTDLEKMLLYVKQQSFQSVLCVGVLGKAADHTIHNLCLLSHYSQHIPLMILNSFDNTLQWIFALQPKTWVTTQADSIISFFPFPTAQLTTKGLEWELNNDTLSQIGQVSMRNKARVPSLYIECKGLCLCFITANEAPELKYD